MPVPTFDLVTTSVSATRALGSALAGRLRAGDVVALAGELGAGKTALVQGAAAALGATTPVTSPTFVLVKHLPAPVPLVHADVYRLEGLAHVDDLDEDVFAPDVITFVEWADRIAHLLPEDRLEVRLRHADDEDGAEVDIAHAAALPGGNAGGVEVAHAGAQDAGVPDEGVPDAVRRVRVRLVGPGWAARLEALEHDLATWLPDPPPG